MCWREKRGRASRDFLEEIGASLERSAARIENLLIDRDQPTAGSQSDRQERTLALTQRPCRNWPEDYRQVIVWPPRRWAPFNVIGERLQRSAGACRMLWPARD